MGKVIFYDSKSKKKIKLISAAALLAALGLCATALRSDLTVQTYMEYTDKLKSSIRIVLVTDLHSTEYGLKQRELIQMIREQKPDMILFSGDIADDKVPHDGTQHLLSAVGKDYPCYYVSGNHEYHAADTEAILDMIRSYGVTILQGESEILEIRGQKMRICGVDDPAFFDRSSFSSRYIPERWREQFQECQKETGDTIYTVLLSHRPEFTDAYRASGFDLVLAGHAHGGQVRLPGILNGLLAPNQGWFPEYAGGYYELDGTTMIVSRGLCKNNLPRIFNPPELVTIELLPDESEPNKST